MSQLPFPASYNPPPVHPLSQGLEPVLFEVGNTDTRVFRVPPHLAQLIDHYTRYPTEVAAAQSQGWAPPEAFTGEDHWDGWIHLCSFPARSPGTVPTGLYPLATWVCDRYGFPYEVFDDRQRPDEGLPELHTPVVDRPYQLDAVEAMLRHGRGVLDMPPRSGKTRTMIEGHRRLALPTIWIAPTSNVVKQTVRAFEQFFGKNHAAQLVGTRRWNEVAHVPVVVCTAATARKLPPEFYKTREMLVIDEFHHAAAQTYRDISSKCPHIYYRFGMTGTFFRSGQDAIAMHAILSRTIYKVTTQFLLDEGYLVPTDVAYLPIDGPRAQGGPSFMTGCGKYGIYQHDFRNDVAAWAAEVLHCYGRKVLVLVGTKYQGYEIQNRLEHKVPSLEFISTDRPSSVCQEVIDRFSGGGVDILIGTSMVGEGTDLPIADALVYAPGGKAEVQLAQAAFRVCTKVPGKEKSIIVDLADRHHRTLMDHSLERLNVFWNEATFNVSVLDSIADFAHWVDSSGR